MTRFSEGGRPERASRRADGRWSASRGVNSFNPHVFCARHRRMVEQQELRAQDCLGIWGFGHSRQVGGFGGTGVSSIGKLCPSATVMPDPL